VPGAAGADALVLTALADAAETFNRLRAAGHRVLVPAFLRFVENAPPATAGGE
jgi:hypothetical protein